MMAEKKNKKYHGVIPPIITPINEHEHIDEKGYRKLLRHCVDRGIHGIFVAGTNGETLQLPQVEREKAIKITIDEVGSQVPVLAGVMDSGTLRVIDNIKRLEQMGGTCAVITSIFYAKHNSQNETLRHFEKICAESSIDIAVYNIPSFTGLKMTAATMNTIAQFDHVAVIKDSSGDFGEFQKLLLELRGNHRISVLMGNTILAGAALLLGADGYVPSIAPLFPELFTVFYDTAMTGNIEKTIALNKIIFDTSDLLNCAKNTLAANKYGISLLGLTDKRLLSPLDPTTPEEEKKIRAKYEEISMKLRGIGLI
jgi:4-hydroxy-tetrahydrodipicolinate synthase